MAQKFIINNGRFLMSASVELHSELAEDHTTTKGGGWWALKGNSLYLYGSSIDYGVAKLEDIQDVIKNDAISSMRLEKYNIYHSYSEELTNAMCYGVKIQDAIAEEETK